MSYQPREYSLEPLEQRVLLSADGLLPTYDDPRELPTVVTADILLIGEEAPAVAADQESVDTLIDTGPAVLDTVADEDPIVAMDSERETQSPSDIAAPADPSVDTAADFAVETLTAGNGPPSSYTTSSNDLIDPPFAGFSFWTTGASETALHDLFAGTSTDAVTFSGYIESRTGELPGGSIQLGNASSLETFTVATYTDGTVTGFSVTFGDIDGKVTAGSITLGFNASSGALLVLNGDLDAPDDGGVAGALVIDSFTVGSLFTTSGVLSGVSLEFNTTGAAVTASNLAGTGIGFDFDLVSEFSFARVGGTLDLTAKTGSFDASLHGGFMFQQGSTGFLIQLTAVNFSVGLGSYTFDVTGAAGSWGVYSDGVEGSLTITSVTPPAIPGFSSFVLSNFSFELNTRGASDLVVIGGHVIVDVAVGTFSNRLEGSFAFENGDTALKIGMKDVSFSFKAGTVELSISGASGAWVVYDDGVAGNLTILTATLPSTASFSFAFDSFSLQLNTTGRDVNTVIKVGTDDSVTLRYLTVDGRNDFVALSGHFVLDVSIGSFVSMFDGSIAFEKGTTGLVVGMSAVSFSLEVGTTSLAFSEASGAWVMIDAGVFGRLSIGKVELTGVSGFAFTVDNFNLELNTTGASAYREVPVATGSTMTLDFTAADRWDFVSVGGALDTTITISGTELNLSGNFYFEKATLVSGGSSVSVVKVSVTEGEVSVGSVQFSAIAGAFVILESGAAGRLSIGSVTLALTSFGLTVESFAIEFNNTGGEVAVDIPVNGGDPITLNYVTSDRWSFLRVSGTVEVWIGGSKASPLVVLRAVNVVVDTGATGSAHVFEVETLSGTLKVAALGDITVTAGNLAVTAEGHLTNLEADPDGAGPGVGKLFYVQVIFGDGDPRPGADKFQWPAWLPIKIAKIALGWADVENNPGDFVLVISASVGPFTGLPLTFTGFVENLRIDIGRLQDGKFPILGFSAAGVEISGNLFGLAVSGGIVMGMIDLNAAGEIIDRSLPENISVEAAETLFYMGLRGEVTMPGVGGAGLMIGMATIGGEVVPLQAMLMIDVPVMIEPNSGLTLGAFTAGIQFATTLEYGIDGEPINYGDTNVLKQQSIATFTNPTLEQWEQGLKNATLRIHEGDTSGAGSVAIWSQPMTFTASVSMYSAYVSRQALEGQILVRFDTEGRMLLIGELLFGNGNLKLDAKLYADFSDTVGGVDFSFYASFGSPSLTPRPFELWGQLSIRVLDADGLRLSKDSPKNGDGTIRDAAILQLELAGGVQFTGAGIVTVRAEGFIRLEVDFSVPSTQTTSLSFAASISLVNPPGNPLGDDFATAAGSIVLKTTTVSGSLSLELYGAMKLTFTGANLATYGLDLSAEAFLQLNTTGSARSVTLEYTDGTTEPVTIKAESFSIYIKGHIGVGTPADPETHYLDMDGVLILEVDGNGLTLYVNTVLKVGPSGSPLMTFDATGSLRANQKGLAGLLTLTVNASTADIGLDFSASLQLEFNTMRETVTYETPAGYGAPTTIIIPNAAPALGGDLQLPSSTAPPEGEIYFVLAAQGTLTVVDTLDLVGSFAIVISQSSLALSMNAELRLAVGTFAVAAGFNISSAGFTLHLIISITTAADKASLGFTMEGTFLLAINTTAAGYTLQGLSGDLERFNGQTIGANSWRLYARGAIVLIDTLRLEGGFEITRMPGFLEVKVDARISLDGLATLQVDGYAAVYSDGIVLGLNVHATFGFSGVFEAEGDLQFRLNTCEVARYVSFNGLSETIQKNYFRIHVSNLTLKFLSVLTVTGSLDFTYASGTFTLSVSASVDFFGLGSIAASGYFDSEGNYSLTIDGTILIGVRGFFGVEGTVHFRVVGQGEGITLVEGNIGGRAWLLGIGFGVNVGISWDAVSGRLRASVSIRISFFFFSVTIRGSFDIGHLKSTITYQAGSSFSAEWTASDSGDLYVNVGQRANLRNYSGGETDEQVFISQDGSTVIVEVFGKKKKYNNVTRVHVSTDSGDDYINVDGSVTLPVLVDAGTGDDYIDFNGTNSATGITAGSGNDTVNGGPNADIIFGGDGKDILQGNGGNDTIYGGSDDDVITGGAGNDTLEGGDGDDLFVWLSGDGRDVIQGQGGTNTINLDLSDAANSLELSASGEYFNAVIDGTTLTPEQVQRVFANMGGGADQVVINHLAGTVVQAVEIALGTNDAAVDSVVINGGSGNDVFRLNSRTLANTTDSSSYDDSDPGAGGTKEPTITSTTVNTPLLTLSRFESTSATVPVIDYRVSGGLDAGDFVVLNVGAGGDYVDAANVSDACVALRLNGESGNDTIIGSAHNDRIDGGTGDDVLTGGAGIDTFADAGGTDTLIEARDTNFSLNAWTLTAAGEIENLPAVFETIRLIGGNSDNIFTISNAATVLYLDGGEGSDSYTVNTTGDGISTINIFDGGTGVGFTNTNGLRVNGTSGADEFLVRDGLISSLRISNPSQHNERVLFAGISEFSIYGGSGVDTFVIDETTCAGAIYGGAGEDSFTVGRILALEGEAHPTDIAYIDTTRGDLAYGNRAELSIYGGDDNDVFEINHNQAEVKLYGEAGDDRFVIYTYLQEGSALSRVAGGTGNNSIRYVQNGPVYIDGGEGFDSVILVGTEADDIFIVTDREIFGGGRQIEFTNVESVVLLGGAGNDTFWVLGNSLPLEIDGGSGDDTINIGGQAPDYVYDAPPIIIDPAPYTVYDPVYSEAFTITYTVAAHWEFGGGFPWFRRIPAVTYSFYFPSVIIGWTARIIDPAPYVYDPNPKTYHFANVTTFDGVVNGVEVYNSSTADPVDPASGATPSERYSLGTINAPIKVVGGLDSGAGDRLNINIAGTTSDLTGRMLTTTANGMQAGTNPVGQLLGLGLPNTFTLGGRTFLGGILFAGLEYATVNLGSGNDSFTVDGTFDDVDLTINGNRGNDSYVVNVQGSGVGHVTIVDSTTIPTEVNTFAVNGTSAADEFLVRAGTVSALNLNHPEQHNETVSFSGISRLEMHGGAGGDSFVIDEVTCLAAIYGDAGEDSFMIGRVLTDPTDIANVNCISTSRGQLAVGNQMLLEVHGGSENDYFEVNHNEGELKLYGEDGDDLFLIRTYLEEGSGLSNVDGGTGKNVLNYVDCGLIKIDGGGGFDRIVVEGTDGNDVFVITETSISVGGTSVTIDFTAVETVVILGGDGNDTITVLSNKVVLELVGGSGDDTIIIGAPGAYDLSGMAGPIKITGGIDSSSTGGRGDQLIINVVDAVNGLTASLDSTIETRTEADGRVITLGPVGQISGLGLGVSYVFEGRTFMGGIVFQGLEAAEINLGSGNDIFTVINTFQAVDLTLNGNGGNDTFNLRTNTGTVTFSGNSGDDTFNLGSAAPGVNGILNSITGAVVVFGGSGTDLLSLDDRADGAVNTLDLTRVTISGMGMSQGIFYGELETLIIGFGSGADIANVRGTSAATTLELNDGDDAVYVSSAAAVTEATRSSTSTLRGYLQDVTGALTIEAGNGRHRLLVSDFDWENGRGTALTPAVITDSSILGLAPGAITYSASLSGSYADGITLWTGSGADILDVNSLFVRAGLRNTTSLNTGDGADVVTLRLSATEGAFFVLHAGAGDDRIDATSGSLGLVLFGGLGADVINTAAGDHVVFGDEGVVIYRNELGVDVARFGSAGIDDFTDGVVWPVSFVYTLAVEGSADSISTGAGNDLILGGGGADILSAGAGNNVILGDEGQIVLALGVVGSVSSVTSTSGGMDTITSLSGRDVIFGGEGADVIDAGDGHNVIAGDNASFAETTAGISLVSRSNAVGGGDSVTTGAGNDLVLGGAGDDIITAGGGDNIILGDCGSLTRDNATGQLRIIGSDASVGGSDTIITAGGWDIIIGGAAGDQIQAGAGANFVFGDVGDADFAGVIPVSLSTISDDVGGDDRIECGSGDDWVFGGAGADRITTGDGAGVIIGDAGRVMYSAGALVSISSVATLVGGDDVILAGSGNDYIIGGLGADYVEAGGGDNIVVGDHGLVFFAASGLREVSTHAGALGGDDTLVALGGRDIILGGQGADSISAGGGFNLVIGDNGTSLWTGGLCVLATSTDLEAGASDSITTGDDDDLVIGGQGGDRIQAGAGRNVILGDHGEVSADLSGLLSVESRATHLGGADIIETGDGDDLLVGGAGADTVTAGGGRNIIFGDSGSCVFAAGALYRMAAMDDSAAGNDTITTGSGADVLMGGGGNDTIAAGEGDNLVFGDSASVMWTAGILTSLRTEAPGLGGDDQITSGAGADTLVAGVGSDIVRAGDGLNLILGDEGIMIFGAAGLLESIMSGVAANGAADVIETGAGTDAIIAGAGADEVSAGDGNNYVIGDLGSMEFAGVFLVTATATDWETGAGDLITTGSGDDVIIGGLAADTINAGAGRNIVLGDHGTLSMVSGVLTSIRTTAPGLGGDDQITTHAGADTIIAGIGSDTVRAGDGLNLILGDEGTMSFDQSGLLQLIASDVAANGAADVIETGAGTDVIIAGAGADEVTAGDGNNYVIGDLGLMQFAGVFLVTATSVDWHIGAGDRITTGLDVDVIISGSGADTISAGDGRNIVLSDQGVAIYVSGVLSSVSTTISGFGGDDQISTGAGSDVIIAGAGSDVVDAGEGTNIVIGDEGSITFDASGLLSSILSVMAETDGADAIETGAGTDVIIAGGGADGVIAGDGSNYVIGDFGWMEFVGAYLATGDSVAWSAGAGDVITTGSGDDVIIGGLGADTINAGAGRNIILGDQGTLSLVSGVLTSLKTEAPGLGGDDQITTGGGADTIIAGVGSDIVRAGDGLNLILGDEGTMYFDAAGLLEWIMSGVAVNGAADVIETGADTDVIIAGAGADEVTAGDGNNYVIADLGSMQFAGLFLVTATSADWQTGAGDRITTGLGDDVIIGGLDTDTISAGAGRNIIFGDHGTVTYVDNVLGALSSASPTLGADDVIVTGDGDDVVIGGAGADRIDAGAGHNIILGDHGTLSWESGVLTSISTTAPGLGGDDQIKTGAGADTVIAGVGSDIVRAGDGLNLILGDEGTLAFDAAGLLRSIVSGVAANGAADVIETGVGTDVIIAGAGADEVTAGDGNNYVIGDLGSLRFTGVFLITATSADWDTGAGDLITTGSGDDVIVGGLGADNINAGAGRNIILGDHGILSFVSGVLTSISTTAPGFGGDDQITTGAGVDTIIAGVGSDIVRAGDELNLILGDEGTMVFDAAGLLRSITSGVAGNGAADVIETGADTDVIIAGGGADEVTAGDGTNYVIGDLGSMQFAGVFLVTATSADWETGAGDRITTGLSDDVIIGGLGADTINAGAGRNIILGDHGTVTCVAGVPTGVSAASPTLGGDDVIVAADGDDVILGGAGSDMIDAGEGNNLVVGDHVAASWLAGTLDQVLSTAPADGGNDRIITGEGNDFIIAGAGDDEVHGGNGRNLVLGDNGSILFQSGQTVQVNTNTPLVGGNDLLVTADGDDLILGGTGADTVSAGNGANVVFGDAGTFSFQNGRPANATTLDASFGGDDTIGSGGGDDIIIGGLGADIVNAGNGNNLVAGDAAAVTWNWSGVMTGIVALAYEHGGSDRITTGVGADIIIGGAAGDLVNAGSGSNVILGDCGEIGRDALGLIRATSTAAQIGGDDRIETGLGRDVIIGGAGADQIRTGDGEKLILGDAGVLDFVADVLTSATSSDYSVGGNDTIATGGAADLIIGGFGDDTILAGDGDNVVLGDHGTLRYAGALLVEVRADAASIGGDDTLQTGAGDDLIVGGARGDTITAGDGRNIVAGDHATLVFEAGLLILISPTAPGEGGADRISAGSGVDLVMGGMDDDTIDAGTANNIVAGDHASFVFTGGIATLIESVYVADGGADLVATGDGNDLIIGGTHGDTLHSGAGNDLVFGDNARVAGSIRLDTFPVTLLVPVFTYTAVSTDDVGSDGRLLGGDDVVLAGDGADVVVGGQGDDILFGQGGDDDLIGGHNVASGQDGSDIIDGGSGYDVIAGDNAFVIRTGTNVSPRARVLSGTAMFDDRGTFLDIDTPQAWPSDVAERFVLILDHAFDTAAGLYGSDYLVGGAGADMLFGELGDDMIHGDAELALSVSPAGVVDRAAIRMSAAGLFSSRLWIGSDSDGDDYIEGNGGSDLIFGGLGQDDIVGGSSSMFGLTIRDLRPDGDDTIYGGNGTAASFSDIGDLSSAGRGRDADVILGDNGNIIRIVGLNGVYGASFVGYDYDNAGTVRVIARGFELLDYSIPGTADDIGGADTLFSEAGDDTIHGMGGADSLAGNGQDDNLYGGQDNDIIFGGSGDDEISHGDELKAPPSRDNGAASAAHDAADDLSDSRRDVPDVDFIFTETGSALLSDLFITPTSSSRWMGFAGNSAFGAGRATWIVFGTTQFRTLSGTAVVFFSSGSLFLDPAEVRF